ncbi:MAG: choice-of-anchor P family protein [Acidimicrobiales bacterium]
MRTNQKQRPGAAALAIVLIVAGLGGLVVGAGPASADVDAVQGSAFGLTVDDNLLGLLNIPPTPLVTLNANEASPPADLGPFNDSLVFIGAPPLLNLVTAGVLNVSTQAGNLVGENHNGFVTSFAGVLNTAIGANPLIPLVGINAVEIQCVADGDGARLTRLTGIVRVQVGADIETIDLSTVAPNTVLDVLGVVRLTLNRQDQVDAPGSTSLRARAIEVEVLPAAGLPGITSALDVIVGEVLCAAQGPDVLVSTTTTAPTTTSTSSTTAPTTSTTLPTSSTTSPSTSTTLPTSSTTSPSTSSTTTPPSSTTTPSSSSTTTPSSSTSVPPSSTTTPSSSTSTTDPDDPGVTTTRPSVTPTTAGPGPSTTVITVVPQQQTVLAKTGSTVRPMVVLSGLSLVLGVLLLLGSSRPVPARASASAGTWSSPAVTRPEKWGPMEIGRALWGAFAALLASTARLFTRRRPPRGRGRSG